MRTATQSLKIIKEMYKYFVKKYRDLEPNLMICEKEDFDIVEKELKALEIIKKIAKSYRIELNNQKKSISFKIALSENKLVVETIYLRTQEEYDLLKEVLL